MLSKDISEFKDSRSECELGEGERASVLLLDIQRKQYNSGSANTFVVRDERRRRHWAEATPHYKPQMWQKVPVKLVKHHVYKTHVLASRLDLQHKSYNDNYPARVT
jgi:hypothetical protein